MSRFAELGHLRRREEHTKYGYMGCCMGGSGGGPSCRQWRGTTPVIARKRGGIEEKSEEEEMRRKGKKEGSGDIWAVFVITENGSRLDGDWPRDIIADDWWTITGDSIRRKNRVRGRKMMDLESTLGLRLAGNCRVMVGVLAGKMGKETAGDVKLKSEMGFELLGFLGWKEREQQGRWGT